MEHPYYNTTYFPVRLTTEHGNHEIWGNPDNGWTAAIPTAAGAAAGCRATSFGTRGYFRSHRSRHPHEMTEEGRRW
jgi:hypothetical protein